ncbi:MAG: proline--tRNA ligase [Bacteroidia bacterium]|nr:proline--tRNA ligase [Bacteroidia bacterium]
MAKGNQLTSRSENYADWYNELVRKADLAENSEVRGCMVIKPWGYAIWERMQQTLDGMFKDTGHVNAYFPLFIPKSFLSKEADHVEGFAKECAVVTHYRLKNDPDGKGVVVDPDAKLEEELIVRPTSETIIWSTYKNWIQSYRDLPLLINQWANVVRWELRTRMFLRTAEFLWQEGHTAHATEKEAREEAMQMLHVYGDFAENTLGIPVIRGVKTESERFAGALDTYTIEALMQDGKALQCGTSHFLGQNFAKAFDVTFANKDNKQEHVWATSWGVSTRLMGALIMTHSDDSGLILPPVLATIQVVFVPIYRKDEERQMVLEKCDELAKALKSAGIRVKVDDDDTKKPGWKFNEWELKGVPVRIAIGPRDLANGKMEVAYRHSQSKEVVDLPENIVDVIQPKLNEIQKAMYAKALKHRQDNTHKIDSWEQFQEALKANVPGFLSAHWDGTPDTEAKIQELTKATIRCIPLDNEQEDGVDMLTGKPSKQRVLFAKAY